MEKKYAIDKYLYNRVRALDKGDGEWYSQLPELFCFIEFVYRSLHYFELYDDADVYELVEREIDYFVFLHQHPEHNQEFYDFYQRLDSDVMKGRGLRPEDLEMSLEVQRIAFDDICLMSLWFYDFLKSKVTVKQTSQINMKEELQKLYDALYDSQVFDSAELIVKDEGKIVYRTNVEAIKTFVTDAVWEKLEEVGPDEYEEVVKEHNLDMSSIRYYFYNFLQDYLQYLYVGDEEDVQLPKPNVGIYHHDDIIKEKADKRKQLKLSVERRNKMDYLSDYHEDPEVSCAYANIVVKMMVLLGMADAPADSQKRKAGHQPADYYNDYKKAKDSLIPKKSQVKSELEIPYIPDSWYERE